MAGDRSYTDDEVEAIFRRAFERQVGEGDGYSHDELVAAAREMGLDDEAIERAVREVGVERARGAIRDELARDQKTAWLRHLIGYLVVVGGALALHVAGLTGVWAIWLAVFWGAGLAMHGVSAIRGPTERQVDRQERRLNRRARREAKAKARREARRRVREERRDEVARKRASEEELERVIEEGVTLLLGAAAKKRKEANAGLEARQRAAEQAAETPPDTDFGRYVARQRAKERGQPVEGPAEEAPRRRREAPKVRVVPSDEAPPEDEVEAARRARRRRGR